MYCSVYIVIFSPDGTAEVCEQLIKLYGNNIVRVCLRQRVDGCAGSSQATGQAGPGHRVQSRADQGHRVTLSEYKLC